MESGGIVHPEYHTATLHVWLLGCEETPEEMAREYLAEIGWFSGEPTEADYIIR